MFVDLSRTMGTVSNTHNVPEVNMISAGRRESEVNRISAGRRESEVNMISAGRRESATSDHSQWRFGHSLVLVITLALLPLVYLAASLGGASSDAFKQIRDEVSRIDGVMLQQQELIDQLKGKSGVTAVFSGDVADPVAEAPGGSWQPIKAVPNRRTVELADAFFVAKGNVLTPVGFYCADSADITTAADCEQAASQLNLKYGATYDGKGDHRHCLYAADGRNTVFFNTAKVKDSKPDPRLAYKSLCTGNDKTALGLENPELANARNQHKESSSMSQVGSLHSPALHNAVDDGNNEHNDLGVSTFLEAEGCFEDSTFNHTLDTFVETYDGKYVTPDESIPLREDDIPYIFAVIKLSECPDWFKANMLHTKKLQAKSTEALPVARAHPVMLVEGPEPMCTKWCNENGIVHVSLKPDDMDRYWGLVKLKYQQPPGVPHEENLWLQSIVRHFALNVVVQRSKINRFVYLDWDTSVFVSSAAAWGVVGSADVSIATCIYPPFASANNIFAMFTKDSCADFVTFVAAKIRVDLPTRCERETVAGSDMDMIMDYFTYFPTWVDQPPEAGTSGMNKIMFGAGIEKHWPTLDEPSLSRPNLEAVHWLHFSERQGSELLKAPVCDDSNILCHKAKRWDRYADMAWGRFNPAWKFYQPKFRMFNLCEPFGAGNVVTDVIFDAARELGSVVGHRMSETPFLWEGQPIETAGTPHFRRLRFNRNCDPYTSQVHQEAAYPSWGWNNFAPEMYDKAEPDRHWYRVWSIHYGTWLKYKALGLVAEECERLFKLHPGSRFVEIDSAQLVLRARELSAKKKINL